MNHFTLIELVNENVQVFSGTVKAVALKKLVKVYSVKNLENQKVKDIKSFFSTKLDQDAMTVWNTFRHHFQIEFLYRDAKQHTGLNNCQARDENKLHFHFNASLTAINLAKAVHWFSISKEQRQAFSMRTLK